MGYDYARLNALLTGRCEKSRKLENHTYAERVPDMDDVIAIRLHATQILKFWPSGKVQVNSGGWQTVTTKARINDYLPDGWVVRSDSRIWYIGKTNGNRWTLDPNHSMMFKDGCILYPSGHIEKALPMSNLKKVKKERQEIATFSKAYMDALVAGEVPAPSGGDCWGCLMVDTKTGKTVMGEDHLRNHIEEKYYVPSLLLRAIEKKPVSQVAKAWLSDRWNKNENQMMGGHWEKIALEQLGKALKRYMFSQLGFGD